MPPNTAMDQQECEGVLQSESPRLPFPTEGANTVREMIETNDDFPYSDDPRMYDYYLFTIEGYPERFGFVHKEIKEAVPWPGCWEIDGCSRRLHLLADGPEETEERLNRTIKLARDTGEIKGLGEGRKKRALFTIKFDNGHHVRDEYVCDIDVAGWQIFGLIAFGVAVIGWEHDSTMYWLQQRSETREMHPGKLDMMAGGGIEDYEEPREAAIREAEEEAGIPRAYSVKHLKLCGTVSYHLSWSHQGHPGSFPHVIHLFTIKTDTEPVQDDDEVERFVRMTEQQVLDELYGSRFKPILPILWIFFFVSTGILDVDKDLVSRMRRKLVEEGSDRR